MNDADMEFLNQLNQAGEARYREQMASLGVVSLAEALLTGWYDRCGDLIADIYEYFGADRPIVHEPDPQLQFCDVTFAPADGGELVVHLSRLEWDGDNEPVLGRWRLERIAINRVSPSILERFAGWAS